MEATSYVIPFLDQSLQTIWKVVAHNILWDNDAIVTTSTWEENQKDFNQIWLEMAINGQETPDQTQAALLSNIANQCPYAGGEAVYQARALLGEGYAYDDETLCGTNQQGLIKRRTDDALAFDVYPNPASVFFTVSLEEETLAEGTATLYDALGRTIMSQPFAKDTKEFYLIVDGIPSGLYFLSVELEDRKSTRQVSILK